MHKVVASKDGGKTEFLTADEELVIRQQWEEEKARKIQQDLQDQKDKDLAEQAFEAMAQNLTAEHKNALRKMMK